MTRKTAGAPAGKVVFVGAGPGDPGMLTARANEALASATVVLVDPAVSAARHYLVPRHAPGAGAVQDVVRGTSPDAELPLTTGEPADVAKAAVAAAKNGSVVVRLVAG